MASSNQCFQRKKIKNKIWSEKLKNLFSKRARPMRFSKNDLLSQVGSFPPILILKGKTKNISRTPVEQLLPCGRRAKKSFYTENHYNNQRSKKLMAHGIGLPFNGEAVSVDERESPPTTERPKQRKPRELCLYSCRSIQKSRVDFGSTTALD